MNVIFLRMEHLCTIDTEVMYNGNTKNRSKIFENQMKNWTRKLKTKIVYEIKLFI